MVDEINEDATGTEQQHTIEMSNVTREPAGENEQGIRYFGLGLGLGIVCGGLITSTAAQRNVGGLVIASTVAACTALPLALINRQPAAAATLVERRNSELNRLLAIVGGGAVATGIVSSVLATQGIIQEHLHIAISASVTLVAVFPLSLALHRVYRKSTSDDPSSGRLAKILNNSLVTCAVASPMLLSTMLFIPKAFDLIPVGLAGIAVCFSVIAGCCA